MNNIWAYFINIFDNRIEKDEPFTMQTNTFKTIDDARKFCNVFNQVDDEIGFELVACVGDEEDYDCEVVGYFQPTPSGYDLEIKNINLTLPHTYSLETPFTGWKNQEDLIEYITFKLEKKYGYKIKSFDHSIYGTIITITNIIWEGE